MTGVVPEQVVEAYLEAVKLQIEWSTTLAELDPAWWKETEGYDRQLLGRIVANLRALARAVQAESPLPGAAPENPTTSRVTTLGAPGDGGRGRDRVRRG